MPPAKDEVARRGRSRRDPRAEPERRDPRAEPESIPPGASGGEERPPPSTRDAPRAARAVSEEVVAGPRRDPRTDPASVPAMPAVHPPEAGAAPAHVDARFADLEPLFARNAWREIVERLGPADKVAELPPALALIYALAQREAAGEGSAAGATELAIKSMAALVGVAADSDTALVLAKRLLRQNPAGWRTKPAPPARLSVLIILAGIALGAAVGWFASLGSLRLF